jgi:hypothetical protein
MRIENLSKEVEMTAVHGGATNTATVGGLLQNGTINGAVLGVGLIATNTPSLSQNASDTWTSTSSISQVVSAVGSSGTGATYGYPTFWF